MVTHAREYFKVIFLTYSLKKNINEIKEKMESIVDECIVLPSIYNQNFIFKLWFTLISLFFIFRTGLKKSNFIIGKLELTEKRIANALKNKSVDIVIYEYWHASDSSDFFKKLSIPVILDMHDKLSSAYKLELSRNKKIPKILKERFLEQYHLEELRAWSQFDGIIAINKFELEEVKKQNIKHELFFCPMGIDLDFWAYSYNPVTPIRFGFYGGLGSAPNHIQALKTIKDIMPLVWKEIPESELWLIGNNPNDELIQFTRTDPRIVVTGFIEDVRSILSSITAIFCPWEGVFGFRSRIVELMALGIPVIASPDAIEGMGIKNGFGVLIAKTCEEFSNKGIEIASNFAYAKQLSIIARSEVESLFSADKTYGNLFRDIEALIKIK